jgi:hypothetical protein
MTSFFFFFFAIIVTITAKGNLGINRYINTHTSIYIFSSIIAHKIHPTWKTAECRRITINAGLRESMLPTRFKVEIFRGHFLLLVTFLFFSAKYYLKVALSTKELKFLFSLQVN